MSIGQLGTSGQSFRDFLGGGQRDIGQGLQAVLSNYANPNGNFLRLDHRTQGMFQLTASEYQTTYDRDAQNSFAQTWYNEYRAVLSLRAEALKKKLNRAYVRTLENSIYAPMRPDEVWAPNANRDRNDIKAETPLAFYSGAVIDNPPNEVEEYDSTIYAHPDWFGPDKASYGSKGEADAYNDIRRYINSQAPLQDIDGDGSVEVKINGSTVPADSTETYPTYDSPHYKAPVDSTGYTTGQGPANANYYDLWRTNQGIAVPPIIYDLNDPDVNSNEWFEIIALKMNVPPSTDTKNFVRENKGGERYFIQIPVGGMPSADFNLLPAFIVTNSTSGKFTAVQRTFLIDNHGMLATDFVDDGAGAYELAEGVRFYDPYDGVFSQSLFQEPPGNYGTGFIGDIKLNPQLAQPDSGLKGTMDEQDMNSGKGHLPPYQQGFLDSWYEARQVQKREAQIEAAYKAYLDNEPEIRKKNPDISYEEIMDQIFSGIDQMAKGTINPSTTIPPNYPPGTTGPMPPPVTPHPKAPGDIYDNISPISGMVPYGYFYTPGPPGQPGTYYGNDPNGPYQVGSSYDTPKSENSIYSLLSKRLEILADPEGSMKNPSVPPGTTVPPMPPDPFPPTLPPFEPSPRDSVGDSKLYIPIPVGAAESTGQPDINAQKGTEGLVDTTKKSYGQDTLDAISNLFVGRQWDYAPGFIPGETATAVPGTKDIAPVKYDAETISSHLKIMPGLWYDPLAKSSSMISAMTLSPPIEGFALQTIASALALGRLDDVANNILGGPFFHVGGGSDSKGIIDMDGNPGQYSFSGTAIGAGILGIYWGHTSAIGTVGKVKDLMGNSGDAGEVGGALQTMNILLGTLSTIGGANSDDISYFPNVGIGGFHADLNIPIPIPIPMAGVFFLNLPMTTYGAASYDVLTDYMHQFLNAVKHEVVDSVSVYSYATSGGYAMDSYGMRGEYHFTEKTAWSTLEKMPNLLGIFDMAGFLDSARGMLGISNSYTINDYSLLNDGVFGGEQRHSMNAGEARELDTGAFFSTAAFLSQFQLNDLEYSYWTGTHQNEEIANMDTLRMLALTGKEIMKFLNKGIFAAASRLNLGPGAAVVMQVLGMMIESYQQQLNENMMWDLLLRDQNEVGFVTSDRITSSSLTAEGYDFIEDEKKLFAYDYNTTRDGGQLGLIGSLTQWGTGSFELPNQVLNGMANTRRYKPFLSGVDGAAGRQGYGQAFGLDGRRAHELSRWEGHSDRYDDNWDIRVGFWNDTGMGDINEVYVRRNVVDYRQPINEGLDNLNPQVTTHIDRYVGSHNRIVGRGYDGAAPLNLQSFRTGYYHDKYFGTFIQATDATAKGAQTATDADGKVIQNAVHVGVEGVVDGHNNIVLHLHGGQKYYDRRNDYYLDVKGLDGTGVKLNASQALAPVLGGQMVLGRVDQNALNQNLGKSTIGIENPLTKVLYDHMHLKEDGSNAHLVKEYRDVFNNGFLDDIFVTASANATMGGGVTSSIRIKFRTAESNASSNASAVAFGEYEARRQQELSGTATVTRADGEEVTQSLLREPGRLGDYSIFQNTNRAVAEIFLSSFYAFKREAKVPSK